MRHSRFLESIGRTSTFPARTFAQVLPLKGLTVANRVSQKHVPRSNGNGNSNGRLMLFELVGSDRCCAVRSVICCLFLAIVLPGLSLLRVKGTHERSAHHRRTIYESVQDQRLPIERHLAHAHVGKSLQSILFVVSKVWDESFLISSFPISLVSKTILWCRCRCRSCAVQIQ